MSVNCFGLIVEPVTQLAAGFSSAVMDYSWIGALVLIFFFFFQAEDGIRDLTVTGVQTCASDLAAGAAPRSGPPSRAATPPSGSPSGARTASPDPRPAAAQVAGGPPRGWPPATPGGDRKTVVCGRSAELRGGGIVNKESVASAVA